MRDFRRIEENKENGIGDGVSRMVLKKEGVAGARNMKWPWNEQEAKEENEKMERQGERVKADVGSRGRGREKQSKIKKEVKERKKEIQLVRRGVKQGVQGRDDGTVNRESADREDSFVVTKPC